MPFPQPLEPTNQPLPVISQPFYSQPMPISLKLAEQSQPSYFLSVVQPIHSIYPSIVEPIKAIFISMPLPLILIQLIFSFLQVPHLEASPLSIISVFLLIVPVTLPIFPITKPIMLVIEPQSHHLSIITIVALLTTITIIIVWPATLIVT